jgi:hypothetical protein
MVNLDNNRPYYPYYVYKWFGNNLARGGAIVESNTSSANFRTLAWLNNGVLNILLISKTASSQTVILHGLNGQLSYQKIDDPTNTSYLNPRVQVGNISATDPIVTNGYTVMILQMPSS